MRLALLAGTALWFAATVRGCLALPGESFAGPVPALDADGVAARERMRRAVEELAGPLARRHLGQPETLHAAARYLEDELAALGFAVERHGYDVGGAEVRNLEVRVPGGALADQQVVVGAHYDSCLGLPGADDNASGVAGVLELARRFHGKQPDRTLVLVLFVNEEPPYFWTDDMGSLVHARRARARGDRIVAMLSLETIGTFLDTPGSQRYPWPLGLFYGDRGNFIALVADVGSRSLVRRVGRSFRAHATLPSEGIAAPDWVPGIGWSDHWSYSREGYDAVMVTDTAPFRNPNYHRPTDTADTLDYDRMTHVVLGLERVVAELLAAE